MQRLYDLHQLGMTDRVFIDATHSRLQHVVGVVEQVSRILRSIIKNLSSAEERQILFGDPVEKLPSKDFAQYVQSREPEIRLIGLLHDLTHAPYGHTLEDEIHLVSEKHDDPARQADAFFRLLLQLIWGLLVDIGIFGDTWGSSGALHISTEQKGALAKLAKYMERRKVYSRLFQMI